MSNLFKQICRHTHIFSGMYQAATSWFTKWPVSPVQLTYFAVILILLVVPYFLFGTRMHIEGDDSHMYFHFPDLWIQNIADSFWMSFSSAGKQDQHFFLLPLLYIFWGIKFIGVPTFVIQNLSFSLIFILGFVFFQKMMRELLPGNGKYRVELLLGAMMYIFSPIILITPVRSYLAPIWLIGVIPLMVYLLVRHIKTKRFVYLAISGVVSIVFSVALNALPWLLGFVLPMIAGLAGASLLFSGTEKRTFLKRTLVWGITIALCQAFWLVPFATSMSGSNSLGGRIFNNDVSQSFSKIVLATNEGNTIIDPLLNLFHGQIQEDFRWSSHRTYVNWYNHFMPLSYIYIVILILGLVLTRRHSRRVFLIFFSAFLVALFLFTVRIGMLEKLFLSAGVLPGFAMFRNFYNKFALSYVLLYATVITFSLVYIKQGVRVWVRALLLAITFLAVTVNAVPFFTGEIINANLQDTAHVKRNIHMPEEYLSFMKTMGKTLPQNANVLDVPYGTSAYTIIAEPGSDHAYSGKSPVKLLSGVSDFSGNLSFPTPIARQLNSYIIERDYTKLRHLLSALHINYLLQTNNIPHELLESSLFDEDILAKTDARFREEIYGERILTSANGNYSLYSLKGTEETLPHDSFVAASAAYKISPELLDASGGILSGPLGNLLNASKVGINGTGASEKFADASVAPFLPGDKINNSDKTSIYVPHNSLYRITESNKEGTLTLQNIARAAYAQDKGSTKTISIGQVSADDLIRVNNEFYTLSTLNEAVLSKNDTITVLGKGNELSGGTASVYYKWELGDCSSQDKDKGVSVNANADVSEITLRSKEKHNACLFSDIATEGSQTYLVKFEYKTNTSGANVRITHKDPNTQKNTITASPFYTGQPEQWNSFTHAFQAEGDVSRMYFFSGKQPKEAMTSFRNVQIHEFSPIRSIALADYDFPGAEIGEYVATSINNADFISSSTIVPTPPLTDWSQGDCNALDNKSVVGFSHLTDGLELKAKDGHNACIRLVTDVNTNFSYAFDFEYYSEGANDDFEMAYVYDPDFPLKKYTEPRVKNAWHHVTIKTSTPEDAKKLTIYLYSGTNKNGSASVKYRNFTMKRVAKTFAENLLITGDTNKDKNQKVSSDELAPHLYRVKAASAKKGFFINFMEPYHDGWELYIGDNNKSVLPHMTANMYTNGWYVDVDKMCRELNLCKQNADGTYDIEMIAEFIPQRWFYVGLIISGTTLLGCITYLIYDWRKRRVLGYGLKTKNYKAESARHKNKQPYPKLSSSPKPLTLTPPHKPKPPHPKRLQF